MARLISNDDIGNLREAADILEIIRKHITLKSAGAGRFKGLCPFHDEKTPSFTVSPHMNVWHCFGCGEHGDIYKFFMKLNSMSFPEAVEHVATLSGFALHYKNIKGGDDNIDISSNRQRLYEINRKTADYYKKLLYSPDGNKARQLLYDRKFNDSDIENFSIGFAPKNAVTKHLQDQGYTNNELTDSGVSANYSNTLTDRFQNRLIWPIFDLTDQVIGFGGRILDNNPKTAKYLNTKETKLYKKSQTLYGINFAKKSIAQHKQAIVVEGYTDVMAMHIAGFHNTVGTCGTAFGNSHAKLLRRIMADWGTGIGQSFPNVNMGEVIFIFDGDEAGQTAAQKSFAEDQTFAAQTSVAIVPKGMDPCDLRIKKGDEAISKLITSAQPLFEYVIKSAIKGIELNTPERRIKALEIAAPIISNIKDTGLQIQYIELAANWLRLDYKIVQNKITKPQNNIISRNTNNSTKIINLSLSDIVLTTLLQTPEMVPENYYNQLNDRFFNSQNNKTVYKVITNLGGLSQIKQKGKAKFIQIISQHLTENYQDNTQLQEYLSLLINKPLLTDKKTRLDLYVQDVFKQLFLKNLNYYILEYRNYLKSIDKNSPQTVNKNKILQEILRLEKMRSKIQSN
ncbi:MAG: DNA primase [Bifidobacteriaceae bacterium]|jgi:DNA primase|nr:DNA primase [Bifidobacteriaceae bacterium]